MSLWSECFCVRLSVRATAESIWHTHTGNLKKEFNERTIYKGIGRLQRNHKGQSSVLGIATAEFCYHHPPEKIRAGSNPLEKRDPVGGPAILAHGCSQPWYSQEGRWNIASLHPSLLIWTFLLRLSRSQENPLGLSTLIRLLDHRQGGNGRRMNLEGQMEVIQQKEMQVRVPLCAYIHECMLGWWKQVCGFSLREESFRDYPLLCLVCINYWGSWFPLILTT